MSIPLFPDAYRRLILEDVEWLKNNAPDSLEREHILCVLHHSADKYEESGYMEAMEKNNA